MSGARRGPSGKFSTLGAKARRTDPQAPCAEPTHERRTPLKLLPGRIAGRVALVVLGLALGAAAGELALRAAGFEYRPHMRNRVYFAEPDALLGWRNRPGTAGPYGGDEFLTRVAINPAGQRGPSVPVARTPGVRRLAVVGDSQAWGDGVGDDETFAALLRCPGLEVLNFACPGYGTDQELLTLDAQVAPYAPDLLLVAVFVGNDLRDNLSPGTFQYPKPYFELDATDELVLRGVPVPQRAWIHAWMELYRVAMRDSALLNAIAVATGNDPSDDAPPDRAGLLRPRSVYRATPTDDDRRALRLTSRLLAAIAARAEGMGAHPVVVLVPELWQIRVANDPSLRAELRAAGVRWRRPQEVLRHALGRIGVRTIDLLPALARASRGDAAPTYYPEWKHLTARGHRVVARHLAAELGIGCAARARG